MPEMRRDCLLNRWVILAPGRFSRPNDFRPVADNSLPFSPCPFCEGNEHLSGPETFARRATGTAADTPGWQIRVVPNRFPALQSQPPSARAESSGETSQPAYGLHEVVVESPRHLSLSATHSAETWQLLLEVYQQRLWSFRKDSRLQHALIFKNHGPAAGASLEHPHSQILVLPRVPTLVAEEWQAAETWHSVHGGCPRCAQLQSEMTGGERLVSVSSEIAAVCPSASRFPYETWLVPRHHGSHFEHTPTPVLADLAHQLAHLLRQLQRVVPEANYNLVLHTAPFRWNPCEAFHWRVEILPRLTGLAGFEMGSGWYVNPVEPEQAARELRSAC
jgi:UDPglucose--hexose-1-phosphate uridylyltransferase